MNTIETIRAKIERLKGQLIRGACAAQIEMETNCKDEAYDEVLAILDTIQEQPVKVGDKVSIIKKKEGIVTRISDGKARVETGDTMEIVNLSDLVTEQPVCEGLEDVADTLAEEHGFVKKPDFKPAKYSWSAVRDVFIEGVIAGAEWQKEQMISALKNDGDLPIEFIDKFHEIDHAAFQNGQKNMKEQLKKEAVEDWAKDGMEIHSTIVEKIGGIDIVECPVNAFYEGQKVRIVIVKED